MPLTGFWGSFLPERKVCFANVWWYNRPPHIDWAYWHIDLTSKSLISWWIDHLHIDDIPNIPTGSNYFPQPQHIPTCSKYFTQPHILSQVPTISLNPHIFPHVPTNSINQYIIPIGSIYFGQPQHIPSGYIYFPRPSHIPTGSIYFHQPPPTDFPQLPMIPFNPYTLPTNWPLPLNVTTFCGSQTSCSFQLTTIIYKYFLG